MEAGHRHGRRGVMRAITGRSAVVALAIAATLGPLAATATAGDRGDNPLEAATEAYRAAYPQLPPARARAAAAQSAARRAVYAAAARTATFGGAWFDPLTGVVHVAETTAAAAQRADALGR